MSQPDYAPAEPHDGYDNNQDLLRTSDVAALFQVSTRTVSEWARRGRVPCMRTPGGQWRYPAEPIRRLVDGADRPSWYGLEGPVLSPEPR